MVLRVFSVVVFIVGLLILSRSGNGIVWLIMFGSCVFWWGCFVWCMVLWEVG